MKRRRPGRFSVIKAVKANARARLGTPPPGAPIPHRRLKATHGPAKHKRSLEEILRNAQEEPTR